MAGIGDLPPAPPPAVATTGEAAAANKTDGVSAVQAGVARNAEPLTDKEKAQLEAAAHIAAGNPRAAALAMAPHDENIRFALNRGHGEVLGKDPGPLQLFHGAVNTSKSA